MDIHWLPAAQMKFKKFTARLHAMKTAKCLRNWLFYYHGMALLPCVHVQGVKQLVLSVVVVIIVMKIDRSRV